MEKRTPHCNPAVVKALVAAGKVRATVSALAGAAALELDLPGIVAVLEALTARDFHKSMTTHGDHTIWRDIYRRITAAGRVYLKLTVIDDVLIVSFKEL
ncbi:MAG: type II toxin-antitoxin system MqsR family toxin [Deltaproteobacteria bacterium]|nr:type II toxin-antitoxin system MqsR family toxin [Deltaproteobacteria bacterium]